MIEDTLFIECKHHEYPWLKVYLFLLMLNINKLYDKRHSIFSNVKTSSHHEH